MIKISVPGLKSWFDPSSAAVLKNQLVEKISDRMQGKKGLFITLTYNRDNYDSPRDLYRKQSEQQHVALFIRRLSRFLKIPLSGRWMRKMEFQEGGWVHFHLVLQYAGFINHNEITRLWGHGHTWVDRWQGGHCFYIAKYMSKEGQFPDWLLFEKPRSVKIVSVSPGFWGESEPKPKKQSYPGYYKGLGAYQPIYFRLQKYSNSTLVKYDERTFRLVNEHISLVMFALIYAGIDLVSSDGGLYADCCRDDFENAIAAAGALAGGGDCLHLTIKRNPDCSPPWGDLFLSLPSEFGIVEQVNRGVA